jgi:integrase
LGLAPAAPSNGSGIFGPVNDKKNRPRSIPLAQIVVDELSAHVARFGLGPDDLLFTTAKGRAVSQSTWSNVWTSAAAPMGILSGKGFHQLRHSYASIAHQGWMQREGGAGAIGSHLGADDPRYLLAPMAGG